MTIKEAKGLIIGDLVIYDNRNKHYGGLVLEVENIDYERSDNWCYRVTLKQPGVNSSFRIENVDTRLLKRFES